MKNQPRNTDHKLFKPGDVFQITEEHGRKGWIGAFVLCTDVKPFGIVGFVHIIQTHEQAGLMFIRLKWEEIEFIGQSVLSVEE